MSPGATMERVYHELKLMIMRGDFAPGERIEPRVLALHVCTSATPCREVLYLLVGERLIESRSHDGFRQPILAEADVRDLYAWSAWLLRLALDGELPESALRGEPFGGLRDSDYTSEVEELFRSIVRLSNNRELKYAVKSAIERSHVMRPAELRVDPGCRDAIRAMEEDFRFGRWNALRSKIKRFHQRRVLLAGRVLAELRPREELFR